MNQRLILLVLLLVASVRISPAQSRHHRDDESAARSTAASAPCFDAVDASDIRLWDGAAPGSAGTDPCRDIPFLRLYPAQPRRGPSPVAIVMPGGGYDRLSDTKEQAPVAEYLSRLGITTFVLYYRLVQKDGTYRYPVPMWDGQRAIKLVRAQAEQLRVDPNRLLIFGFSAGGHLASTLALHAATDFDLPTHDRIDAVSGRPNLLGLGYPVISMDPDQAAATNSHNHLLYGYRGHELDHLQSYLSGQNAVTSHTPPTFLFESMDDARISPQNSVLFAQALRTAGIPTDVHLFAHGEHGAGLATGIPEEESWPEMLHQWLLQQGFLDPARGARP